MKELLVLVLVVGAFIAGAVLTDIGRERMEARVRAEVKEVVSRLQPDPEPPQPLPTYNVVVEPEVIVEEEEPVKVAEKPAEKQEVKSNNNCRRELVALGICRE